MKRQRGQSALEFALMAPLILFIVFGTIYGGIMFMQFLNYSNEARTIARQIAVSPKSPDTDKGETKSKRQERVEQYNGDAVGELGIYNVSLTTVLLKDDGSGNLVTTTNDDEEADEVSVRFEFDHGKDFPFGFPPRHFAASYHMQLEKY